MQESPVGQASGPPLLLDQAFDSSSMYQLRASVAAHAADAGLSQTRAEDLVVAVHELAANVVRHGSGAGRLLVWRHHDELHCQITDDGDGKPAAGQDQPAGHADGAARATESDPADSAETWPPWRIEPGHGLWLVRQLADRVRLQPGQDGATVATVVFSLARAGLQPGFRLTRSTWPAGMIFAVNGELDVNSAAALTTAVDDLLGGRPAARLILDLEGLTFWDSFGLAALLRVQSHADATASAELVLTSVPDRLLSDLTDAGLLERFTVSDTTDQAIAETNQPPP